MVRTTAIAATAGESNAVFQHVAKGRRSVVRLQALLGQQQLQAAGSSTLHGPLFLTEQILCCFDHALAELRGVAGTEDDDDVDVACKGRIGKLVRGSAGARAAASSKRIRVERKGSMDDNYLWRKYGQKDIKNSKYPRFYYRCSYKHDHGCMATKQVQQSETDQSVFDITYFGEHTCGRVADDGPVAVAVDGDGDESEDLMVISFGSSGASAYPWPCCGEDAWYSGTSQPWSLPEWEKIPPCMSNDLAEEVVEESTPVPGLMGLISLPHLEPNLLDLQLGESSFDIDELISFDEFSIYSIDNTW